MAPPEVCWKAVIPSTHIRSQMIRSGALTKGEEASSRAIGQVVAIGPGHGRVIQAQVSGSNPHHFVRLSDKPNSLLQQRL